MFTGSLLDIAATELRIVLDSLLPGAVDEIERVSFGRAQVLRFGSPEAVATLAPILGQLSCSAALFVSDGERLTPVLLEENLVYGAELATTQRYRGKTNERLTRAMLNCALAAAGISPASATGTVLDPMCGRGTSLNWALAYGLDGVGIETDGASLEQHATFLETWAKRARLPHKAERFRKNNSEQRVFSLRVGADRAELKSGGQRVQTFAADAADLGLAIKRKSVDCVVTDLPYGVQHRGAAGDGATDDERETASLMERVLPVWHRHLRPGGSLCLAWNTKRASRKDLSSVLVNGGFAPITIAGGFSMRHVVDASIDRDVIVAVKQP